MAVAREVVKWNAIVESLLSDDEQLLYFINETNSTLQQFIAGHLLVVDDEIPKITSYAEVTVPQYSMDDFRSHYRVSRFIFETILRETAPHLVKENEGGTAQVQPQKMLLLFCWYMANMESLREIGHTFGVAVSTAHAIITKVAKVFQTHLSQIIKWPDANRQQEISNRLQQRHQIPGVVGFVDGTHIRLPFCPKGDADYMNRKKFPSVVLQVVVDDNLQILHAYAGWPGCTHDARVLRNSALYREAEAGQKFIPGHFIIGDSAYPLREWLITVFRDNGHLTPQERRFNAVLSSMRQVVERSIGHLKGRFRKLREVYMYKAENICKIIYAGCILHNLCVIGQDDIEDYIDVNFNQHPNNYPPLYNNAGNGVARRQQLMQFVQ